MVSGARAEQQRWRAATAATERVRRDRRHPSVSSYSYH